MFWHVNMDKLKSSMSDSVNKKQLEKLMKLRAQLAPGVPKDFAGPGVQRFDDGGIVTQLQNYLGDAVDNAKADVNDYVTRANTGYAPGNSPADKAASFVGPPDDRSLADKGSALADRLHDMFFAPKSDDASSGDKSEDIEAKEDSNKDDANEAPAKDLAANPTPEKTVSKALDQQTANDDETDQPLSKGDPHPNVETKQASSQQASPSSLKDMLNNIFGTDLSDSAIKEAQQHRNELERQALSNMAGEQIAAGLSRGAYKPTFEVEKQMMASAPQGISDILQRRQGVMQQMQGGLALSDLEDKDQMRNASSPVSAAYRNMALQLNPKLQNDPAFQNMSGEAIKNTIPMVDMSIRMQAVQAQHEFNNSIRAQQMQYKQQQDSARAKSDMSTHIQQAMQRAAPMQAQQGILAANKIDELFNNEPNPEKWNSDQVHLFKTETEKLARGGTPTESGQAALIPPTITSRLAQAGTFITGDKIGSGQGQLVNNLRPYISGVRNLSSQYLRDNVYKPIMTGYNKRVAPDDMQDYKSSVPANIFPENGNEAVQNFQAAKKDAGPPPSSTIGEPMVNVTSPQGVKGQVPASKLKAALAKGFTQ